uniref:Proteasome maturation protein n=1 Tax=Astatotilapia calliptera TaxID=8154 RepID=A0AAX7TXS4_ASTCA
MCRHQNETLPDTAVYRKERGTNEVTMNSRGLRSQLKDSVPVAGFSPQGAYGVQDSLRSGFTSVKNELLPSHPLELSEKNFQLNQDKMNFSTLRNIQGLHAPLKLQMEYRAARQVAAVLFQVFSCFVLFFSFSVLTPTVSSLQIQRLPFLQSSNLALDTLRNSDESIGFEDVLNDPAHSEVMGEPHMMVEYKLGLL